MTEQIFLQQGNLLTGHNVSTILGEERFRAIMFVVFQCSLFNNNSMEEYGITYVMVANRYIY